MVSLYSSFARLEDAIVANNPLLRCLSHLIQRAARKRGDECYQLPTTCLVL
jgi:hypothetical protein